MESLSRKLKVLGSIIEQYVLTGEPVGSKTVCEDFDNAFSSATIRNEMANLVNLGYLFQPHVSSGRVPSFEGYRLYINKLMNKKPLPEQEKNLINGVLGMSATDPESLLTQAARIVSEVTGCTAIITTPPSEDTRVKDIKFVKIGRRSAMIVLMTSSGMVKNKLFKCGYDLSDDILRMFSGILNEKFLGELLKNVTPDSINFLVGGNRDISLLLIPVFDVFMQAVKEACVVEVKVHGRKNLLEMPGVDAETITDIFNFLESNEKIIRMLSMTGGGINFIVGEENIYRELKHASVVSSRYSIGGKSGVIGVVGSTRIDYGLAASQIEYVSALVGVLLARILEND